MTWPEKPHPPRRRERTARRVAGVAGVRLREHLAGHRVHTCRPTGRLLFGQFRPGSRQLHTRDATVVQLMT